MRSFGLSLLLACVCAAAAASSADDRITSLPGFPGGVPSFAMYSGYLTVNATTGKNIFYWFAESQGNPATDPLIVWYQGGPGCSSLLGFFMENGPLIPLANGSLTLNPFAWNTFANTLYIDSPVGVGFSYSNTPSDYNTDNNITASDNLVALNLFLARFPAFQGRPLWLSGESYAGDYVPQLAYQILTSGPSLARTSLTGLAIGNPVFSCPLWKETANDIQMDLFYWHGMVPLSAYRNWKAKCSTNSNSGPCNALLNEYTNLIGLFDPDNIYTNFFTGNASLGVGATPAVSIQVAVTNYLNEPAVQTAIHAQPANWTACCAEEGQSGGACALNYTNNWVNMLPYYDYFHAHAPSLRTLIYSGDTDVATCPHAYAQLCLGELNRAQLAGWAPWTLDNQTAGFSEVYDGYTYATVKGAGHEVPLFQPREAQHLISSFIAGKFP